MYTDSIFVTYCSAGKELPKCFPEIVFLEICFPEERQGGMDAYKHFLKTKLSSTVLVTDGP